MSCKSVILFLTDSEKGLHSVNPEGESRSFAGSVRDMFPHISLVVGVK